MRVAVAFDAGRRLPRSRSSHARSSRSVPRSARSSDRHDVADDRRQPRSDARRFRARRRGDAGRRTYFLVAAPIAFAADPGAARARGGAGRPARWRGSRSTRPTTADRSARDVRGWPPPATAHDATASPHVATGSITPRARCQARARQARAPWLATCSRPIAAPAQPSAVGGVACPPDRADVVRLSDRRHLIVTSASCRGAARNCRRHRSSRSSRMAMSIGLRLADRRAALAPSKAT